MTLSLEKTAFADTGAQSVSLSSILSVTNDGDNPTYLVVNGLDRNEYTKTSTGKTGTLTGDGATASFASVGGDARGLDIVFTWNAATDSYVNATYGNLLNLTVNTSASPNELADLSFFGTNSQSDVTGYGAYLDNAADMVQLSGTAASPFTYLGTASFATQAVGSPSPATEPSQATPDSICATAMQFVGDTWNLDGCWVLASTIDAEAGAALPVTSSFAEIPGQASGEWKIAYNGPVSANANWQSLVQAGDQVALITGSGSGHITTVVSGSGSSAMLVDNIDYGSNLAKDGDAYDLTIAPAHSVSQEFTGAPAADAVIYRLDTPTIAVAAASETVGYSATLSLGSLFSASDWAGTGITGYQVYESSAADSLVVNGVACTTDISATACASLSSLSGLGFLSGAASGTDMIEVRAVNADGYWGDWASMAVIVGSGVAAPAPILVAQTAGQTLYGGQTLSLSVAGAFRDPSGETLTYSAALASGAALPGWLTFNATTDTFSGIAPAAAQGLSVTVTATNSGGSSASETFSITDKTAPAPLLVAQTATQTVYGGKVLDLSVASAFRDPSGEALTYTATLSSGAALPSWLSLDASTGALTGTAPATAQSLAVKVTATNLGGTSASEVFTITDKRDAPVVSAHTPTEAVYTGHAVSLSVASAFTDPGGETLTYAATLSTGKPLPSWLSFNTTTGTFSGTAPTTAQSLSLAVTATNLAGNSVSETFTLGDVADVPVGHRIAAQTIGSTETGSTSLASAFTEPGGEALTYTATLANGQALPSWLSFDPATDKFSGTAPITAETLSLKLTATNTDGHSASETFSAFIKAATTGSVSAVTPVSLPDMRAGVRALTTDQILGAQATDWLAPQPLAGALTSSVQNAGGSGLSYGEMSHPVWTTGLAVHSLFAPHA